jgi:hypothetical protein
MAFAKTGTRLPTLRRQQLLAEFSGLKQACPDGVYATLAPGDPSTWSGVLFVRRGPYAGAVLRFQLAFPASFPRGLPLITFATDMFHPLVTPLTTYTYSTDIQESGTVSATDDERLPPGGFSLRHGFPDWFGRGRGQQESSSSPATISTPTTSYLETKRRDVSVYEVLRYLKSAFDDEALLDDVPREAAGNPGAWEAWRARNRVPSAPRPSSTARVSVGSSVDLRSTDSAGAAAAAAEQPAVVTQTIEVVSGGGDGEKELPPTPAPPSPPPRGPSDWNWSGVWEDRVRKGIRASCSEAVLYGGAGLAEEAVSFYFICFG